jgi:hypothetical protein
MIAKLDSSSRALWVKNDASSAAWSKQRGLSFDSAMAVSAFTKVAEDRGWVKKLSHLVTNKAIKPFVDKANGAGFAICSSVSGSPPKSGNSSNSSVHVSKAWVRVQLAFRDWTVPILEASNISNGAFGIRLVSFSQMKSLVRTVQSDQQLILTVPGHLFLDKIKDKNLISELTNISTENTSVIVKDRRGSLSSHADCLVRIGASGSFRGVGQPLEIVFAGNATKTIIINSVLTMLKDEDTKKVESELARPTFYAWPEASF